MYRVWSFVSNYSLLLILGAIIAVFWANIHYDSYHHFVEYPIVDDFFIGHLHVDDEGHAHRTLTLHYLINDVLMALFFAIAGKEVWEAVILKDGSLRGKKAMTPLIATAGGVIGPILVYIAIAFMFGSTTFSAISNGWAIPTATDIAFAYLVGRLVFGSGHPAVQFLLLLAIADDAVGLILIAVFYTQGALHLSWLLLSLAAAITVFVLFNWLPRSLDRGKQDRPVSTLIRTRLAGLPYVVAGCISWYAFQEAGIHPALGLLPIIPTIPHADRAFGIFNEAEKDLDDQLNSLEHALQIPVEFILFFFGLANAGVLFSSVGPATYAVLGGLFIGKPIGIWLFGMFAANTLKLGLPEGMKSGDLFVLGCVAGIGFTVALFVASVAFPAGSVQDAAKMGALLSFSGAIISFIAAKICKVKKVEN